MLEKIKIAAKEFFDAVLKGLKNYNYEALFTNPKTLIGFVLLIGVLILSFMGLGIFTMLKGLAVLLLMFFIFAWNKPE